MADTKISAMTPAATLDGTEIVPLVQTGANVQTNTSTLINQTIQAAPATARTSLGLGTMAVQNANAVAITGGSAAVTTLKTLGLTGYLYGNNTNAVTASTTIPYSVITGGPANNPGYYGAFHSEATQTAAAINTPYAMTFSNTDLTNGVSLSSGSRIVCANAGTYNFAFSAQLDSVTGSAQNIVIWARINGTDVPYSASTIAVQGTTAETIAAWNFFLTLTAGQYFELVWAVSNTNVQIVASAPNAVHPGIPSVILTVNQIA